MTYKPTIGLEVHAELSTKSKMFCGCKNAPHESEPNTHVCPVCLAQPGTLPTPNKEAIKKVLLFGEAIGANKADYSEFDRKNYFYPDIPKAYQISQYAFPFLSGGELSGVELTRVHLEEDTARSQHDKGTDSLVDFNRAGVPLMELVTEPVIHDAETAGKFAKELQLLLRTLGISEANMERGEMRVEANISVSDTDEFGTKVEVKNLNSFKSVVGAIEYEIARHIEVLEAGGELTQETRGWDEQKGKTFSQRSKETAKDYRYFPDPDLTKMEISEVDEFSSTRLSEIMPVLPNDKRLFYSNLGLTSEMVETLMTDMEASDYFYALLDSNEGAKDNAKLLANYLTSDIASLRMEKGLELSALSQSHFVELGAMISANEIGSRVAKDMLPDLFGSSKSPRELATEQNLLQVSDESSLAPLIEEIIAENPEPVEQYKAGKEAAIKFLLGQGMKKTKGAANPAVLEKLLIESIK